MGSSPPALRESGHKADPDTQELGKQAPHFVEFGLGLPLPPSFVQYHSIIALLIVNNKRISIVILRFHSFKIFNRLHSQI